MKLKHLFLLPFLIGLFAHSGFSQCVILSDSFVCVDEPIGFSIQSSTAVSSVSWDFGDGNNSSQISPVHRYTTLRSQTVTATVSLVGGGSCKVTKDIYVHDPPEVDIRISSNSRYCLQDNVVCLIDSSKQGVTGSSIVKRIIFWGDGNRTETNNPNNSNICYNYKISGNFTITVELINDKGCSEFEEIDVEIFPKYEPSFYLDSTARSCAGVTHFYESDSSKTNPIVDKFIWDFGDGNTDTTNFLVTNHTHTVDGLANVRLIVTTIHGCVSQTENSYFISTPKVDIDVQEDSIKRKCFPSSFEYAQTPNSRYEYNWLALDSNLAVVEGFGESANGSFLPPDVGKYIIRLTVSDGSCAKSAFIDTVESVGVKARTMLLNNLQCAAVDTVYACNSSSIYQTDSVRYLWNFKDTAASSCTTDMYSGAPSFSNCNYWWGEDAKHFYNKDSCADLMMVAYDEMNGCVDSASGQIIFGKSRKTDFRHYAEKYCYGIDESNVIQFLRPECGAPQIRINFDSACGKNNFFPFSGIRIYTDSPCDSSGWVTVGIAYQNGSSKIYRSCDTTDFFIDSSRVCQDTFWYHNWFQLQPTPITSFDFEVETCVPATGLIEIANPTQPLVRNLIWDWGDGTVEDTIMPDTYDSLPARRHVYKDALEFVVRVTMRTDSNCEATRIIRDFTGYANDFNFDNSVCIGEEQTLRDEIYYWLSPLDRPWRDTTQGIPEKIFWDFGDGNGFVEEGPLPTVSYPERGEYTIRMASEDRQGCTDTISKQIFVGGSKSGIKTINKTIICDDDIQFFDSSITTNPEDSIVGHKWFFGDGRTPSVEKNPFHFYSVFGEYEITHVVYSANGCIDTSRTTLVVDGPIPSFDIITDTVGCAPHTVTFDNTSSNVSNYIWYFGDQANSTLSTNRDTSVSFTYTQPGTYYIYLYGSDSVLDVVNSDIRFCQDIFPDTSLDMVPIRRVVVLPFPQANFGMPSSACVGEEITLRDLSDPTYESYNWYISNGDSVISGNRNASYTFDSEGTYTVYYMPEFTPRGLYMRPCFDSLSKTIVINPPPSASFDLISLDCDGLAQFENTSPDFDSLTWDFDDPLIPLSTDEDPQVDFNDSGSYNVQLFVENQFGCLDTANLIVDYDPRNRVIANLVVDPTEGCAPMRVKITNNSSDGKYFWNLGDGTQLTDTNIRSHLFDSAGIYQVRLIVEDSTTCNVQDTATVVLRSLLRPVAGFFARTNYCTGEVEFRNLSTNAETYLWDFGDGRTSNEKSPVIRYDNDGTYEVLLTVNDTLVCRSQFVNDVVVETLGDTGLFIPNVFTPDYDDFNSCYRISGASPACYEFDFKLFNRWGDLVYESKDVKECWNGKDRETNANYPEGTYYYILKLQDKFTGEKQEITGTITLIR